MYKNYPYPITTPKTEESKELIAQAKQVFLANYKPREMVLERGVGARVWDLDGNEYIDLGAGIAVNSLGYNDADLKAALLEAADKIWHASNIFYTSAPINLASALVEATPFARGVYFANSGAEANEAAIKLIRKYAADSGRAPEQREILTFTGSFHGRTMGALAATAQPKYQQGFEPLPAGFVYCDGFNNMELIRSVVNENTCAILIEPVQGEGGVMPAKAGFLKELRAFCNEKNLVLAYDEIQCGIGRTGKLFSYMHEAGAEPDLLTSAKALGCGVPIGAMLVGEKLKDVFVFGSHGSTFGGNPLMCAVGLAAFKKINTLEIMDNVERQSIRIRDKLAAIHNDTKLFADIRGQGLMVGAELVESWRGRAGEVSEMARRFGVLVLQAGPDVLRFLPPLNISDEDLDVGLERLHEALLYLLKK